jgi:hypothetical protein
MTKKKEGYYSFKETKKSVLEASEGDRISMLKVAMAFINNDPNVKNKESKSHLLLIKQYNKFFEEISSNRNVNIEIPMPKSLMKFEIKDNIYENPKTYRKYTKKPKLNIPLMS